MAKGSNQKLKLMYLAKLLQEQTDEHHGVSTQEIISYLDNLEIPADRKTIYQDLEELGQFGFDIGSYHEGRTVKYQLLSRDFELPELKLLVDSVQSSKFITEKKSRELIKKLEKLTSNAEARELHRQVILTGRVKTLNESIYYNVDAIHDAIHENRQITFQYVQWDLKKQQTPRRDGALYQVSPWALLWDNEYYYMIAFDKASGTMKHYRVDKMRNIASVGTLQREGKAEFDAMDLPRYSRALFGMFGGEETDVTLLCDNTLVGVLLDRFGTDIPVIPVDDTHFRTTVRVIASNYFLGWIIGLGDGITILGPDHVVENLMDQIQKLQEKYKVK